LTFFKCGRRRELEDVQGDKRPGKVCVREDGKVVEQRKERLCGLGKREEAMRRLGAFERLRSLANQ
jgi:hypothetical protein